jgi:hypothetical protein
MPVAIFLTVAVPSSLSILECVAVHTRHLQENLVPYNESQRDALFLKFI